MQEYFKKTVVTGLIVWLCAFVPLAAQVRLQYRCEVTRELSGYISFTVNITNTSQEPLTLADLSIRYYLSLERTHDLHADISAATLDTENMNANFWDQFAEIHFSRETGSLNPGGQTGGIRIDIYNSQNSSYDQSNDYSFNGNITSLTEYTKITLYNRGTLIWGTPPQAMPAAVSFIPDSAYTGRWLIQAEDFQASTDNTPGNSGGSYRSTDTEIFREYGEGYYVQLAAGEKLSYQIKCWGMADARLEADLWLRLASETPASLFHIEVNGINVSGPQTFTAQTNGDPWALTRLEKVIVQSNRFDYSCTMDIIVDEGTLDLSWMRFQEKWIDMRPTPTSPPPTPAPPTSMGDVNLDGAVNILDALMTAQFAVGLNPSGFTQANADVNCDRNINIIDALMIAQTYIGLIILPGNC